MTTPVQNPDPDAGTPPVEVEETAGTPPEDTGDEPDDDGGVDNADTDDSEPDEADVESSDDDDASEESADEDQDDTDGVPRRAWENLSKKFSWIKDPEDRQEAIAKAYWEKARYDKQVRKENEDLKAELSRMKAEREAKPKEDEKPPPPHPDIVKIETRIKALYEKGQKIQDRQNENLKRLTEADRQVAIAEDRLKDAFDENKPTFEERLRSAKRDYEYIRTQILEDGYKLDDVNSDLERHLADRDWVEKWHKDQAEREEQQKAERARFDEEFPKQVDSWMYEYADKLGLPKDDRLRKSLWKHVNRALMVDLRVMNAPDVTKVDVPAMVRAAVREYAEDRDLIKRKDFKARSEAKLATASRTTTRPAAPAKAPDAPEKNKPVPAALLGTGSSPAMRRARELLVRKLG